MIWLHTATQWLLWVVIVAFCVGALHAAEVKPWPQAPTPAYEFDNFDGTPFDASSLRGKRVVVNFWAVWCVPCREELPALEKMAESLRGQQVEVLLVNAGDSMPAIEKFLAKVPVKLRVLRTRGESVSAGEWQVNVLPTTVLVDAAGTARWRIRGSVDAGAEPVRGKLVEMAKLR
jgi:thiol-disulfide isomerase/thioredoxin